MSNGDQIAIQASASIVRSNRESISEFLYTTYLEQIDSKPDSTIIGLAQSAHKRCIDGAHRDIAIPVPPLPEQQRIVGILDEAFEGIATAKANAEKNLQNARALFESHLQSVFAETWYGMRLGQLAQTWRLT